MTSTIYRNHTSMPWPNGLGITYEVVRAPQSGDFDWRISLADIDNDCPFSVMPGVDRGIVLMEGDHMNLTTVEGKTYRVDELVSFGYPGEIAFDCTLPAGAAKDLNIMTRRGKFTQNVTVLGGGDHEIDASKDVHILVGLRGETVVDGETLRYREAAVIAGPTTIDCTGTVAHIVLREV